MGYNAQLVVRSRDPEGTAIIEKVKELADEQGKTYSEMALELLERSLDGAPQTTASAPSAAPPKADEPVSAQEPAPPPAGDEASEPDDEASEPDDEASEPAVTTAPPSAEDVEEITRQCIAQLAEHGAQSAARTLAAFFSSAGPIEGGKVKGELKEHLTKAEYDVIMGKLRQTKEYRNYRQRVIFER